MNELINVFEKHHDELNMVAVFSVSGLQDWIEDCVKNEPTIIYPLIIRR